MKLKKMLCFLLSIVMAVSLAACGSSSTSQDAATDAKPDSAEATTESALSKTAAVPVPVKETPAGDVSVAWEDSHVYPKLTLGCYDTISTYAVKGYDEVPFIRATDYLNLIFEGKEKVTVEDDVMKVELNGTEAVIDPATDTVTIENPSRFRSPGEIDGAIVEENAFNVITYSTKNKTEQTDPKPLTISLADYQLPVIAYEDDILMPFLALQNIFGGITWMNVLAYNGKDYYNVFEANSFGMEHEDVKIKETPYVKALYSGPFSKKEKTTQAYANYAYYTTCLMLDLTYGHKEEKNITTFDEYFTRINAKKSMTSTSPDVAMMAEMILFMYLFDSGHDALSNVETVFGKLENMDSSEAGKVVEDIKNSDEGKEVFDDNNLTDDDSDLTADALVGALTEKGFKIPEIASLMLWGSYMGKAKPKNYGEQRLDFEDDTAVIYFNAFKEDHDRNPTFYLDPLKKEDEEKSNFAFFYRCFKDIKKHDNIKNVVINLSDNGGGDASALIEILGFLSKDGEALFTDQDLVSNSYRKEFYHVDTNLDGIADDQDGFGGQYDFFIMTSPDSYSCANALPYFAQKQGLAKIIGAKPGGGDCVVGCFVDAYGHCGGYSGMLKIGVEEKDGKFVSDEKTTTLDLDMMPTLLDIGNVPWFDAKGITDAVHQYKKGKKKISYGAAGELEDFVDKLKESMK